MCSLTIPFQATFAVTYFNSTRSYLYLLQVLSAIWELRLYTCEHRKRKRLDYLDEKRKELILFTYVYYFIQMPSYKTFEVF